MHHEYIHSCPMWSGGGPCLDCTFVISDLLADGMCSLDIACILCFFSFKHVGKLFPCAVMHWFDHIGDGPDTAMGMWIVCPSYCMHNHQNIAIIHIDTINHTAHLIPIFSCHNINSRDVRPHNSYGVFHSFYVNKYAVTLLHGNL
ncbi:hypothetical protein EDD15DRAFT_2172514 [Pisolithus albus]|nr:hypothetical protein EDD15DRAFT_2172514 [Pisolithus albus]